MSEPRDWTNADGKTISAELISSEGHSVTIKMANRANSTIPLNSLSTEDQEFVKMWLHEQEVRKNTPVPATQPIMCVPGKLIYQSSLKDLDAGWSMPHGEWKGTPEGLQGAELEADDHAAVMKRKQPLEDFIIEFDVMLGDSQMAAFGIDNNDHMCRVTLTSNTFRAMRDDNDHEGPDKGRSFNSVKADFKPNEWQTVRLEMLGSEFLAQTGDLISMGSDPLFKEKKGKWGFVVKGSPGSRSTFRNLTIWTALPNENWGKERSRLKRRLDIEE